MKSLGYTYKCQWEKDFDADMAQNEDLKKIIYELNPPTLVPKDVFFGVRMEAITGK